MMDLVMPVGPLRQAVIVLGMHRSGTSFLGSLAQSLGVDMGQDLYPPDEHNPAGYFEDRECVDIQDRMLAVLGQQPWHGPKGMSPFAPLWWRQPDMLPLVAELERWLDRRLAAASGIWGVKDPRTTRFLPLWNDMLARRGVQPCYVLAVRDPAEVVASIRARDGAQAAHVYRSWLRFNLEALLHAGKNLTGVFSYAAWFHDGEGQLQRLAQALGMEVDAQQAAAVLQSRLREDLHRQTAAGMHRPDWAQNFYAGLLGLTEGFAAEDIARLTSEAEYADALLRQGEVPQQAGALCAVVTSTRGEADGIGLAERLRDAGYRVVLACEDDAGELVPPRAVARVVREVAGPELGGWFHTRRAYALWLWLRARAFAQVHVEAGQGLAVHVLDARRQGWPDACGELHVHYFARPHWLEPDGLVHLHDVLEAEALCLERRAAQNPHAVRHAPPALSAALDAVLGGQSAEEHPPGEQQDEAPLVSVCITHFNRPELLSDCLASVRAQRYGNYEVVLVDDGSTQPAARAYLDALQAEFDAKGWTLIRQENRYLGAARNAAARAARGNYLFILDDDNLLMPDGLRRAVQVAQRTQADVVTAVMALFSGTAECAPSWPDRLWPHSGNCPLLGLMENNLGDANALVRRSSLLALGGYTEDRGVGAEDWELYAKVSLRNLRLEHSVFPFSWYRVDANSMSRAGQWWRDYRRALCAYEAALPPALRELPALTGVLWRRMVDLEPFEPETIRLREYVALLHTHIQDTQAHLQTTQAQLEARQFEVAALNEERDALYRSSSWRLTAPLRFLKRKVSDSSEAMRLFFKGQDSRSLLYWIARGIYRKLPLPVSIKTASRDFVKNIIIRRRSRKRSPLHPNDIAAAQRNFDAAGRSLLNSVLLGKNTLRVPKHDNPLVSIIIVLYNKAHLSALAIEAIIANCDVPYELIIVNNASSDNTKSLLGNVDSARIIENEENLGFGPACNQAADQSSGTFLFFLNNDALLQPNSVEVALQIFSDRKNVGAVGGKILLANRALQEAGSIIWSDGSTLGYGRGDDEKLAKYNFRRPVDYCSGAFLITPRKVFIEHGGFDARYSPAYYEDVDYCMTLWANDLSVWYEPRAAVVHYESASSGATAVDLSAARREIFKEKWSKELRRFRAPMSDARIASFAAYYPAKHLFYLDDRIPNGALGSGYGRSVEILKHLASAGYIVTVCGLNFPIEDNLPEFINYDFEKYSVLDNEKELVDVIIPKSDLIWVSRSHNFEWLLGHGLINIGERNLPIIYDMETISSERERLKTEVLNRPKFDFDVALKDEIILASSADVVVAVSKKDKQFLGLNGISNVHVISHCVQLKPSGKHFEERNGFLFVGAMHDEDTPNADSMRYFCQSIWPAVRDATGAQLIIAGYGTGRTLSWISDSSIIILDAQDDLMPLYDAARVFIAPTRYGAGIPLKAIEAAAHGLPIVATPLIAEQLGWTDEKEVLIGNDPESFAQCCILLYRNGILWSQLMASALADIEENYDLTSFQASVDAVLMAANKSACSN